jgi:hypothetical protein
MVRLVLVGAILAGCYAPQIADCVDRCGQSGICPDGLTCVDSYCRVEGAVGTCSPENLATDAPAAETCPPTPVMQGCTPVGPMPQAPSCMVACAAQPGATALAFRAGSWHAAVIGTASELALAMTLANGEPAWLGLTQAAAQPTPSSGWSWVNGAPMSFTAWAANQPDDGSGTESGVEQCGVLVGGAWIDEPCSTSHVFLIEPF